MTCKFPSLSSPITQTMAKPAFSFFHGAAPEFPVFKSKQDEVPAGQTSLPAFPLFSQLWPMHRASSHEEVPSIRSSVLLSLPAGTPPGWGDGMPGAALGCASRCPVPADTTSALPAHPVPAAAWAQPGDGPPPTCRAGLGVLGMHPPHACPKALASLPQAWPNPMGLGKQAWP